MTKPTVEEVYDFHLLLKGFIDHSISVESALEIIKERYEREDLVQLLEEYYQEEAVFTPLIETLELRNLLIYFFEINSKILKMPLKSGSSANRFCILHLVLRDALEYTELYDWIEANKPEPLEAEKKTQDQILEYQKQLTCLINDRKLTEFQRLLKGLPQEILVDVLHQGLLESK
jgi:hypothetical protein